MNLTTKVHYITFDTVFDTKLDIILKLMDGWLEEDVEAVLTNYNYRRSEYFHTEAFGDDMLRLYEQRTVDNLRDAVDTSILDHISNETQRVGDYYSKLGVPFTNTLYINTYPYIVPEEALGVIMDGIVESRPFAKLEIKAIHKAPIEVTPKWLKDNKVEHVWDVAGLEWINLHAEAENWAEGHRIPGTFINVPGILPVWVDDQKKEYTKVDENSGVNIWDSYTVVVSPLIKLNFMLPIEFSAKRLAMAKVSLDNQDPNR